MKHADSELLSLGAQSISITDRRLLRAFVKERSAENFGPLLERYAALVYSAARRQTSTETEAAEVARAVFFALARRAWWVPRRAVLAGWLFRATRFAARKFRRTAKKAASPIAPSETAMPASADPWARVAPHLDAALIAIPSKLGHAVLLRGLLNLDSPESAKRLRLRESRAEKRFAKGLRRLARRLRKRGPSLDVEELARLCQTHGSEMPMPEELRAEILGALPLRSTRGPAFALTRRTLAAVTLAKWRRRLKIGLACFGVMALLLSAVAGVGAFLWKEGRLFPLMFEFMMRMQAASAPELAQPARSWPADAARSLPDASVVRGSSDLFQTTNIWPAHLRFSPDQWRAVSPKRIPALPMAMGPGDKFILRNPKAKRSGLAGVLGFEFGYAHADLEFGGATFKDVAARIKGNGTFLGSLSGLKRSFKVQLSKFEKEQELGGLDVINFTNLIEDRSYMADALAHEFFRDSGIPAPRTAYAYLTLSVEGEFERKPLGLYLLVENLDGDYANDRFGSKAAPIFKPVTYELFQDLGDKWSDYAAIYDLKTKATEDQQRRVIEFAKLLSHADDAEFARRLGEFLDLDEFARFLGGLVLVSSYDGLFSNGQNFYVFLDPRSNKFGFIAWDLDHAWGNFPFIGTAETRERASIWHPWVGENRFLERVTKVEEFRKIYRARLEEMLATTFVAERLNRRIDAIAAAIRDAVAAESNFRLSRFDQAVSEKAVPRWEGEPFDPKRTAHQLKRFITHRAKSVRLQLDGKSKGMKLTQVPMGGE